MNSMAVIIVAGAALVVSVAADRRKTLKALRIAGKRFIALLPSFLTMLAAVSLALTLLPQEMIIRYLGDENTIWATLLASGFGSVTLMPGFISFPLAGILLSKGVAYMTLSAFTTTLMMVGVLTYPVEKEYFGTRLTIIRNAFSFFTALVIAIATGLYFGEIFAG